MKKFNARRKFKGKVKGTIYSGGGTDPPSHGQHPEPWISVVRGPTC